MKLVLVPVVGLEQNFGFFRNPVPHYYMLSGLLSQLGVMRFDERQFEFIELLVE